MKIHSIEIHNILSIEHASLTFGDAGLVLVEGFDYDTGRGNGAGKSAIFNALSFALYDKVPRRITKSEILRTGTKSGFSYVEVSTASGRYGIKRSRPVANTYYKDGKEVDMTQEEFERVIGLNYEQFLVTMYTAQDTPEKFINLNDSQKKAFILKIMDLGKFTKAKDHVSEQLKLIEVEKSLTKVKLDGYKSNIEIYKTSMVDPVAIQAKIDQNNRDIIFYNTKIKDLESVPEPDMSKYEQIERQIAERLNTLANTKYLLRNARKNYDSVKNLKPDANCPGCNIELIITNKFLHKCDDSEKESTLKSLTDDIHTLEADVAKEPEIQELVKKIKSKKQDDFADYHSAQSSISEYRNSINIKNTENNNLSSQIARNDEIKLKVKDIITHAQALSKRQKELSDEQFLLDAVGSIFDTTGAPAYVMDSIIDSFNEAVSEYISEIWPNATYSLQTYKTNKDKSVKAKFSETLTVNGKDTSIGSLSGGEIRALSLALDFAIIEVLSSQYGLALNPVILDEPFNGLDSTGRELIVDLLAKFSQFRQVWVVDHANETKTMFNQVVRVEKRNGVSKIA